MSFSSLSYDNFSSLISEIAKNCNEDALVILETTVPPGTTEKVVEPIFRSIFELRNLDFSKLKLAHSYERVMPGAKYLDSITKSYRVFAATNVNSSNATREFLETFIDTKNFPLSELDCPTASEMAKVLENSYRAANIAFIRQWGQFAQDAGVDLYDIIEAIRVRSTHNNIMWPGFGVGGYCLSKDSLLADWSAKNHFKNKCGLKSSVNSVKINDRMPEDTVSLIKNKVGTLK